MSPGFEATPVSTIATLIDALPRVMSQACGTRITGSCH
jgi:hypothetical protein